LCHFTWASWQTKWHSRFSSVSLQFSPDNHRSSCKRTVCWAKHLRCWTKPRKRMTLIYGNTGSAKQYPTQYPIWGGGRYNTFTCTIWLQSLQTTRAPPCLLSGEQVQGSEVVASRSLENHCHDLHSHGIISTQCSL
jgi:hypothetical protein